MNVQDAVVDRGRAAVAVGGGERDLAGPLLDQVVPRTQVADVAAVTRTELP